MNLIRILDTDDWAVDYDQDENKYRASFFIDYHFVDEIWFDAYKEKEYLVRCKDCKYRDLAGKPPFMYYYCTCDNGLSSSVKEDGFCPYGELRID